MRDTRPLKTQKIELLPTVEARVASGEKARSWARENKLNELSGKDWIKFTKSWFVHRPKPRGDQKIRHPASFPESLVREFILFFTKKGQLVIDPFLGTGSTLVASLEADRAGVGFEIVDKYAEISRKRVAEVLNEKRGRVTLTGEKSYLGRSDPRQFERTFKYLAGERFSS